MMISNRGGFSVQGVTDAAAVPLVVPIVVASVAMMATFDLDITGRSDKAFYAAHVRGVVTKQADKDAEVSFVLTVDATHNKPPPWNVSVSITDANECVMTLFGQKGQVVTWSVTGQVTINGE